MNKEEIEAFKNELKNLWFYHKKITECHSKLELLEYDMENVKGVDYTKQHGTYNEHRAELKKLAMIEEKGKIEGEMLGWQIKEAYLAKVLKQMSEDERELVIEVIADGRKYRDVCEERKINNTSSLFLLINQIIDSAIKKAG